MFKKITILLFIGVWSLFYIACSNKTTEQTFSEGSEAVVYIPAKEKTLIINGQKVSSKEKEGAYKLYSLKGGNYKIEAK